MGPPGMQKALQRGIKGWQYQGHDDKLRVEGAPSKLWGPYAVYPFIQLNIYLLSPIL